MCKSSAVPAESRPGMRYEAKGPILLLAPGWEQWGGEGARAPQPLQLQNPPWRTHAWHMSSLQPQKFGPMRENPMHCVHAANQCKKLC